MAEIPTTSLECSGNDTLLSALIRQVTIEVRRRLDLAPSDRITLTRRNRNLTKRGDFLLFVPSLLRSAKPNLRRSGGREGSHEEGGESDEEDVTPDLAMSSPDFKVQKV